MNAASLVKTGLVGLLMFGCLSLGVLLFVHPPAESYILDRGIWIDRDGTATAEAARAQAYRPFQGDIASGYMTGAQWIRLRTRAHAGDLLLWVWPLWLDRIEVFTGESETPLAVLGAGQAGGPGQATILGRTVILPASGAATVWLRVKTATTSFVSPGIVAPAEAIGAVFRLTGWIVIHLGALALLAVSGLLSWLIGRDRLFLAFAFHQTVYLLYAMDFYGVTQLAAEGLFEAAVAPVLHAALTFLVVSVFVGYEAYFIARYKAARLLIWMLALLSAIPAFLFGLWLWGARDLAFSLNPAVYLASLPLLFAAALSARPARTAMLPLGRGVLIGYAAVLLASVFWASKGVLGGQAISPVALYWFNLGHGTLLGIMMLVMLLLALRSDLAARAQARRERDQAVARYREQRGRAEEKSRFLQMLMHELNTPLAVATFALSLPERSDEDVGLARKATRDMQAIIDRCVQDDRVGAGAVVPRWQEVNLSAVIDDLVVSHPSLAVRVTRSRRAPDVRLQSDPQLIRIILANLLDNAEKYGSVRQGGVISQMA